MLNGGKRNVVDNTFVRSCIHENKCQELGQGGKWEAFEMFMKILVSLSDILWRKL